MKRLLYVMIIIMIGLFCSCETITINDISSDIIMINDVYLNSGLLTAYDDGFIYFFSNEKGKQGIYRMKEDGSDVNLYNELSDVKKIIVNNNEIFYIKLKRINKQSSIVDPSFTYGLFYNNLLSESEKEIIPPYNVSSIVDADITSDGNIVIHDKASTMYNYLYFFNRSGNNEFVLSNSTEFQYGNENTEWITRIGSFYVFTYQEPYQPDSISLKYNKSIFDRPSVINTEKGYQSIHNYRVPFNYDYFAFLCDSDYIYCSYKNNIILFDHQTRKIVHTIKLDNESESSRINSIIKYPGYIYFVVQSNNVKSVYKMNLATLKPQIVFKVDNIDAKQILSITEEYVIYRENDDLYKYYITEHKNVSIAELKFLGDNKKHIFETKGQWLFIHSFFEARQGVINNVKYPITKLEARINLQTYDIIINRCEVDNDIYSMYVE